MESENQLIESRLGKKLLAVAVGVNPGLVAEQVVGDWLVFVAEVMVEFLIGNNFLSSSKKIIILIGMSASLIEYFIKNLVFV